MPFEPALAEWSVLLGIADTRMAASLSEAIRAEGIHANFFLDIEEARELVPRPQYEGDIARLRILCPRGL